MSGICRIWAVYVSVKYIRKFVIALAREFNIISLRLGPIFDNALIQFFVRTPHRF